MDDTRGRRLTPSLCLSLFPSSPTFSPVPPFDPTTPVRVDNSTEAFLPRAASLPSLPSPLPPLPPVRALSRSSRSFFLPAPRRDPDLKFKTFRPVFFQSTSKCPSLRLSVLFSLCPARSSFPGSSVFLRTSFSDVRTFSLILFPISRLLGKRGTRRDSKHLSTGC